MRMPTASALLLFLLPLHPVQAPAPAPEAPIEPVSPRPGVSGQPGSAAVMAATDGPALSATASPSDRAGPERPRWPDGWPSLDPAPAGPARRSGGEIQTMGSGELDIVLEGTRVARGDDDRQVTLEADVAEVDRTPEIDVGAEAVAPGEGKDPSAEDEKALERLGRMIRDRDEADDEEVDDAEESPKPFAADEEDLGERLAKLGEGILLRGVDRDEVERGVVETRPGEPAAAADLAEAPATDVGPPAEDARRAGDAVGDGVDREAPGDPGPASPFDEAFAAFREAREKAHDARYGDAGGGTTDRAGLSVDALAAVDEAREKVDEGVRAWGEGNTEGGIGPRAADRFRRYLDELESLARAVLEEAAAVAAAAPPSIEELIEQHFRDLEESLSDERSDGEDEEVDEAPPAEAEEVDETPPAEAEADPAGVPDTGPVPGYVLWSADGEPLESLVLGQPFWLELRLSPDEAGIRSQLGGLREFQWVEVTLLSEDGAEHRVRLDRQDEPSADGLVRFLAREPISLAGTWRKPDGGVLKPGAVDDLDLDIPGWEAVRLVAPGITGGTTAVRVYGDEIERGVAVRERRLAEVEELLSNELRVAEAVLADPAVAGHPDREAEVRRWIDRTERLLGIVDGVQQRMAAAEDPRDKLRFARAYLGLIVRPDRDGNPTIVVVPPTGQQMADALSLERRLQEEDLREKARDGFRGYSTLTYSLVTHASLGAPIHQLIYGRDEFDREASRLAAVAEIAGGVVALYLPGAIASQLTEWKAGGFGLDIRLPGSGGGPPGGGILPARPGKLAALTNRGRDRSVSYPGAPRATPRPPRPGAQRPVGVETGGGRLPDPETGPRRGLDPDELQHWRDQMERSGLSEDRANALIGEIDEVVGIARESGVPDPVIAATLREARGMTLDEASPFVSGRLEIETALHTDRRIFLDRGGDVAVMLHGRVEFDGFGQPFVPESGALPFATPAHLSRMSVFRRGTSSAVEGVRSKVHLELRGEPQTWSPDEIAVASSVARRLESGAAGRENPRNWLRAEVHEFRGDDFFGRPTLEGLEYLGVRRLFTDADLEAISTVFRGQMPGGAPSAPVSLRAGTPPPPVPSLATPGQYASLLERQAGGELLDFSGIARPGIARVVDDGEVMILQGAGRWDGTRPDGWMDLFVPASDLSRIPEGVPVRVLETGVSPELVRDINLLSSRGRESSNPHLLAGLGGVSSEWTRVQIGRRHTRPRMSDVENAIRDELASLRESGVNVEALQRGIADLSSVEQLAVIRDPAARARAILRCEEIPPCAALPTVIDPSLDPTALGGPSGRGGGSSPVEVVIQSTGGSTGPVLVAHFLNHGDHPVRIRTDALNLEPVDEGELDPEARARVNEILEGVSGGKPVPPAGSRPFPGERPPAEGARGQDPGLEGTGRGPSPGPWAWRGDSRTPLLEPRGANVVSVVLDGYCLEMAKDVPEEGVLFRIAERKAQRATVRFREVVQASRRLQELGALRPAGDPESYFHSIRQWAVWVDENGFDRKEFEEAFVEHARKNFEAAGRPWTDEVREVVRSLVPNRWDDLRMILGEAERSVGAGGGSA